MTFFLPKYLKIVLVLISVFIILPFSVPAQELRIDFFHPSDPNDSFWKKVETLMNATAVDLNIKLRIHYAYRDRNKMIQQLNEALSGEDRPDGIVFQSYKKNGLTLLKIAEEKKIPSIVFNAGLDDKSKKLYGGPRETFKYWIGQILPNDEKAGFDLANILIEQAKLQGLASSDGYINMFGIIGPVADGASIERVKGLQRATQDRNDVRFYQYVQGHWKYELAKIKFQGLIKRYPQTSAVWAANDPMALGAIHGAVVQNIQPGDEILVGGIDWTQGAINAISEGKITVSIGGHFMEGSWVLILMYDYLKGHDFKGESIDMRSEMYALTRKNVDVYLELFGSLDWGKIDFTKFSKFLNPKLEKYPFHLKSILQQLPPTPRPLNF